MKRFLVLLGLLAACGQSFAGEAIWAFQPGTPPPAETLKGVPVKGVVAEFLDPDGLHLGKEVGNLIWREILTAVSDQGGAGVIFARPPDNQRLEDMLQLNYHRAAVEIAEAQKARMALWGAVSGDQNTVVIDTYLSLIGDVARTELAIKIQRTIGAGADDTGLAASIARVRFNFPRAKVTRDGLFRRVLVVQADTDVRDGAVTGPILRRAHAGEVLQADDMTGEWFRIALPNGRSGYVKSWNVYVPPRQVSAQNSGTVELYSAPNVRAPGKPTIATDALLDVLASRYVTHSGLWYQVKGQDHNGWVRAAQVRTYFSLPVVHFVAGLYRYQLGSYHLAADEFDEYIGSAGVSEDPASLSTAYQLLGVSLLATNSRGTGALAHAVAITPYDANVRVLNALASLADAHEVRVAMPDMTKALELDPEQPAARNLVAQLLALAQGQYRPLVGEGMYLRNGPNDLKNLTELADKYGIPPLPPFKRGAH